MSETRQLYCDRCGVQCQHPWNDRNESLPEVCAVELRMAHGLLAVESDTTWVLGWPGAPVGRRTRVIDKHLCKACVARVCEVLQEVGAMGD